MEGMTQEPAVQGWGRQFAEYKEGEGRREAIKSRCEQGS